MRSTAFRAAGAGLPPTTRAILASAPKGNTTVHGWLKSIRVHKNVSFLEISDGTTSESVQAVVKGPLLEDMEG
jgi:asparaginyl-tRNA synthetase